MFCPGARENPMTHEIKNGGQGPNNSHHAAIGYKQKTHMLYACHLLSHGAESVMKHSARLFSLLIAATLSLAACSGLPGIAHTMAWQEEVLLHDGRIVIAERKYNLGGYPTLDSWQRSVITETTTFSLPDNKERIIWRSDFRDTVPEPNSLNLLLFDVVNGVPYLATYPAGCIAYNKWQRPNPFYVLFKHEQGGWKRISMEEFPAELAKTNVIVGGPEPKLLKPYYTIEGVNAGNYYLEPKYKAITRTIVESPEDRCGAMVRTDDGGWLGIGWFSDQPTYEACLNFCEKKNVSTKNCPCKTFFKETGSQ
jgi:hypothetical protein